MALVLLTLTTVLGLLSAARVRTRRWPAFAQVDLHKRATLLALVFLGLHVVGAVVDTYVHVGLVSVVVPFTSSFQPFWTGLGAVAVDLLAAVAISSALRQRIAPRAVAGPPLAGLRLLAVRHGPRPRRRNRRRPAVDGRHRRGLHRSPWSPPWPGASATTAPRRGGRPLGATTRAVPVRHRPVAAGPDATGHGATPDAATARRPPLRPRHPRPPNSSKGTPDDHLHAPHVERLLHSGPGGPTDPGLSDHLALHGPLVIPRRHDPAWSEALLAEVAASGSGRSRRRRVPGRRQVGRRYCGAGRRPVVVVNAMEGEPASAKDRALLAWSPHLVLDGAELVAALSGARSVVVCVADDRDDSARAVRRAAAERSGAGSVRELSVRRPAGPVRDRRGVGTGLLARARGRPSGPAGRQVGAAPRRPASGAAAQCRDAGPGGPDRPARRGLVPQLGAEDAPGSTLVTVSGAVRTPGVVEVELGTPRGRGGRPVRPDRADGGLPGRRLRRRLARTRTGGDPARPAPLARVGATLGVGIVVALPADVLRHRRDGADHPVDGRRERGPVRPLRLRPARHRRRPRSSWPPAGPTPA